MVLVIACKLNEIKFLSNYVLIDITMQKIAVQKAWIKKPAADFKMPG
jgi:hypothetical protein